jgi:hypothetical protein
VARIRHARRRYRYYVIQDTVKYKREMVLLYLPLHSELVHLMDQNKPAYVFDLNEYHIVHQRNLYEANIHIERLMAEMMAFCVMDDMDERNGAELPIVSCARAWRQPDRERRRHRQHPSCHRHISRAQAIK